MRTIKLADDKVEPAVYQEDLVGYVFMFFLVGSVITAWFFWYFFARDTYPGTSTPEKSKGEPQASAGSDAATDRDGTT